MTRSPWKPSRKAVEAAIEDYERGDNPNLNDFLIHMDSDRYKQRYHFRKWMRRALIAAAKTDGVGK